MERKSITEIINQIVEKQGELTKINDNIALYNRTATNDGSDKRIELAEKMKAVLDEIVELSNEIKNY